MKRLLILLLILTLPLASAQINNPKEINTVDLKLSTTGTLAINGNVKYVNLNLYSFPKSDYYSKVIDINTEPSAELKTDGERQYYSYYWGPTQLQRESDTIEQRIKEGYLDYSLTADIDSRFVLPQITSKQEFPYKDLNIYMRPYTEATLKVDSEDEEIKKLANNLATGEDDAYKLAFKFAKYVNGIVEYDKNYLDGTQKASWVLENKKGVCDEYTVLFMALSRSVGIPVRYVSGVAYSNLDNDFIPHSWAEVWFEDIGWVPFDPTYGEYGWIDSTHIRMQDTLDSEVSAIRYIWEVGDVEGDQPDIKVVMSNEVLGIPSYVNIKFWVEKPVVGFGSYNIIWAELENPTDQYIIPEIALIKSPQVIDDNYQHVFLEPYSTELVYWIVKVPSDIDKKYTYTYAIESSAILTESKTTSFTADYYADSLTLAEINEKLQTDIEETAVGKPDINININRPDKAYVDKPFDITVTSVNNGNTAIPDLKICVEQNCKTTYIGISEEIVKTFNITSGVEGENKIKVTFTGEGIDTNQIITISVTKQTVWDFILDWFEKLLSLQ
jgi:transglutaminase-like putative cysteine protease